LLVYRGGEKKGGKRGSRPRLREGERFLVRRIGLKRKQCSERKKKGKRKRRNNLNNTKEDEERIHFQLRSLERAKGKTKRGLEGSLSSRKEGRGTSGFSPASDEKKKKEDFVFFFFLEGSDNGGIDREGKKGERRRMIIGEDTKGRGRQDLLSTSSS